MNDFRQHSRQAIARAKGELTSAAPERLKYAALELRLCIEALTYDRAQAFKAEIPPEHYNTWQPRKLLLVLLEIEPTADKTSTLRIGEEPVFGETPDERHLLGTETVFDLHAIKKHYDALGSYLHMPTLSQLEQAGDADFSKLRVRCQQIVTVLEAALASPVFNVTLGNFSQLVCMECGETVRKRFPAGMDAVDVECFKCHAEYRLSSPSLGKVNWEPKQQTITCPTESCGHRFALWNHEVKPGAHWQCRNCDKPYRIGYAVFPDNLDKVPHPA